MICLTEDLSWSPDGYNIETIRRGEYETLPNRAQEIADKIGILVKIDNPPPIESDPSQQKHKKK